LPFSRLFPTLAVFSLLTALVGCNTQPPAAPAIGHAYAGPATLNLHQEIDSKSPTAATVHHGDRLAIVAQRRRWYRVRTAAGAEGWTSDRELLDSAQMQRLKALAAETNGLPSQGAATTFSALNVHTEPSRQSPSFVQMKEHEKVDVIAHRLSLRAAALEKRQLVPPRPKIEKKSKENEKKSKIPPPPAPPVPPPPADWRELSKQGEPPPDETETPRGPVDDWTLIRTENGQSGWVLTSSLYMAIPDEVAQYAEGHRITSYFSIGKIRDGDMQKDIWLWTTSEGLGEDHDFDGYRVFTWSIRRHRYETAFIQRRERGFFPVMAKQGEFSVCLEQPDGTRVRKQYRLVDTSVRAAGATGCMKTAEQEVAAQNLVDSPAEAEKQSTGKSRFARLKAKVRSLFGK
jgi:uncharacterized protein YgiM (DUF1202 family)